MSYSSASYCAYPYRPQRYHAWDVAETSPRVSFPTHNSSMQSFQVLNFSEEGLCFECPQDALYFEVGDLIRPLKAWFGNQSLFEGCAKIKHKTFQAGSKTWQYGLRLLENKLSVPEVFAIRNQLQDRSLVTDRLRRTQRAPRYGRELLNQFEVRAELTWENRQIPVQIENVSEFGFCFSLDAMAEIEIFAGDVLRPEMILQQFSFSVDGKNLFTGRVRIIHVSKKDFVLRAGVFCLDGGSVSVAGFETAAKLRNAKKGFINFLEKTDQSEEIHPEFKVALNDFRYFLEYMKDYLERTEVDLQKAHDIQERSASLAAVMNFSERILSERVKSLIGRLEKVVLRFSEREDEIHRKYFQAQMMHLISGSLVFRRAMEKPLGYAGDYEMMNGIYHHSREGKNLWEQLVNSVFAFREGPQAVRNRAQYLQNKITQTVSDYQNQETIRILSLACGPCEEIQLYLQSELSQGVQRKSKLHFYLLDQEEKAFAYAQSKLYPLASQFPAEQGRVSFDFLQQGVKHLLKNPELVASYPKVDLIYTAGLFDYLPEATAQQLTAVLLDILAPGGTLIIGNFNEYYPTKFLIQYISDWFLIHRGPEQLMNFLPDDEWRTLATVEQEESGVNLFLNVRRPVKDA